MSKTPISVIEHELERFPRADQERLSEDFASYLRRLRALRLELEQGERAVDEGQSGSVADLDRAIRALRRQYAGI